MKKNLSLFLITFTTVTLFSQGGYDYCWEYDKVINELSIEVDSNQSESPRIGLLYFEDLRNGSALVNHLLIEIIDSNWSYTRSSYTTKPLRWDSSWSYIQDKFLEADSSTFKHSPRIIISDSCKFDSLINAANLIELPDESEIENFTWFENSGDTAIVDCFDCPSFTFSIYTKNEKRCFSYSDWPRVREESVWQLESALSVVDYFKLREYEKKKKR